MIRTNCVCVVCFIVCLFSGKSRTESQIKQQTKLLTAAQESRVGGLQVNGASEMSKGHYRCLRFQRGRHIVVYCPCPSKAALDLTPKGVGGGKIALDHNDVVVIGAGAADS